MVEPAPNIVEYTVSEISAAVKRTVEDAFGYVRVRGEISGYRGPHSSGHAYFSLKDDKARIEAVVWRMTFQSLRFKPEEGLEVVVTGQLTTFPGSSKYQIVIEALEPAGAGALMALLEERKRKFAAEGLFGEERKKPLPYLPRVIGVVTSPTGAVIRDILHRLEDRFPTRVIVWPVRVQGETSAAEVAAAIAGFNALAADGPVPRPDLLIVARGGGSLEDLWSFNEETVVRAAAASAIPLISAVGHETDFTLIDFVADRRAPTPTAAAEMAVPVRSELIAAVADLSARQYGATSRQHPDRAARVARRGPRAAAAGGHPRHPAAAPRRARGTDRQGAYRQHQPAPPCFRQGGGAAGAGKSCPADRTGARPGGGARGAKRQGDAAADRAAAGERLEGSGKLLEALSYRSVLARGFALVSSGDGLVRSAAAVTPGMALRITFGDGAADAVATGSEAKPKAPTRPAKTPRRIAGQPVLECAAA